MKCATTKRPVVLVVEDEFLIRMHAAEMIEEAGFEVWKHQTPTKPLRYSKQDWTSPLCLPISKCRDPWMG
jgi:FixJ family two-component response regulator